MANPNIYRNTCLLMQVCHQNYHFNTSNFHQLKNVSCGEVNIIDKHFEGLEKPVGCSELSVVACRLNRGRLKRVSLYMASTKHSKD